LAVALSTICTQLSAVAYYHFAIIAGGARDTRPWAVPHVACGVTASPRKMRKSTTSWRTVGLSRAFLPSGMTVWLPR